jgi:hypothetical protein
VIANRAARMRPPPDLPAPHSRDMLTSILTRLGATVVREVCQPEVIAMFRLAISEAERSPEVAETLNASRSRLAAGGNRIRIIGPAEGARHPRGVDSRSLVFRSAGNQAEAT